MTAQDRDGPESARDAALERAWREASTERPPPHLDAAIVAAARNAGATGQARPEPVPGRTRWLARWQPLLAAAAVAGLAVVLVPMLPRDPGPAMQERQSTSAPASEPAPGVASAPEDATVVKPAPPPAEARPGRLESVVPPPRRRDPEREIAAPASTPAPAAAESATESYVREGERGAAADLAGGLGQAASPTQATTWAARIEALHAAGDIEAAARELREFRQAEPRADAYLSEALRDWAQTVEPFSPDPGQ